MHNHAGEIANVFCEGGIGHLSPGLPGAPFQHCWSELSTEPHFVIVSSSMGSILIGEGVYVWWSEVWVVRSRENVKAEGFGQLIRIRK